MSLEELIEKDLNDSLNEFGIEVIHYFKESQEKLRVIFEKSSEIILDAYENYGVRQDAVAEVVVVTLPTKRAKNIKAGNIFKIEHKKYKVLYVMGKKDFTTEVFLEELER